MICLGVHRQSVERTFEPFERNGGAQNDAFEAVAIVWKIEDLQWHMQIAISEQRPQSRMAQLVWQDYWGQKINFLNAIIFPRDVKRIGRGPQVFVEFSQSHWSQDWSQASTGSRACATDQGKNASPSRTSARSMATRRSHKGAKGPRKEGTCLEFQSPKRRRKAWRGGQCIFAPTETCKEKKKTTRLIKQHRIWRINWSILSPCFK